ncbi:MAG TPA: spore coat U domain-containing protein [Nitrospira sp.]|nr:spore coat U domain-containing protein [Nitrospira sp.]
MIEMKQWKLLILVSALMFAAPTPVRAAVDCNISTVGVSFGSYNVFSAAVLTSTGNVSIRCTGIGAGVSPVSVFLNPGLGGSFQPRTMIHGADKLNYNLYLDSAGVQIWGDGTSGTQTYNTLMLNNRTVNITVFGRIPPSQDVSTGSYTDTIVATINF